MTSAPTDLRHRRLIAAAGASLIAVVLVWPLADSTRDRAIASAVAAGAITALFAARRSRRAGSRASRRRHALRVVPVLLGGAVLCAIVAPVLASRSVRTAHQDPPQAAVRDFLSAAVVDNDGLTACSYLAPDARLSFEHHSPTAPDCESFFGDARLTLGGLPIDSNAHLNALNFQVEREGRDRYVQVSSGDQSTSFLLRPASTAERDEPQAPPTPWRIHSSVAHLETGHRATTDTSGGVDATAAPAPGAS